MQIKSTQKNIFLHGPHKKFAFGTQRNLYSTDSGWGFCVRWRKSTQREWFCVAVEYRLKGSPLDPHLYWPKISPSPLSCYRFFECYPTWQFHFSTLLFDTRLSVYLCPILNCHAWRWTPTKRVPLSSYIDDVINYWAHHFPRSQARFQSIFYHSHANTVYLAGWLSHRFECLFLISTEPLVFFFLNSFIYSDIK